MRLRATRPALDPPIATDAATALDDFSLLASRLAGMPVAFLLLNEAGATRPCACHGIQPEELSPPVMHRLQAWAARSPMQAQDDALEPNLAGSALQTNGVALRALLCLPLLQSDGQHAGCLCVADTQPRQVDARTLDSLYRLAAQITLLLSLRANAQRQQNSERVLREREVEVDRPDLVAQHEHARAILQSLPNGVMVYDHQLRVVQANPSAERIFGVDSGALLGCNTVAEYSDAVDDSGLPLPPQRRPALLTLIDGQARHDVVYGLRMKDGQRRWLRVSTAAMRNAQGAITGVIGSFVDHTEERQQHALLQLAIDAARITPWHWNLVDDVAKFDASTAEAAGLRSGTGPQGQREIALWPIVHRSDVEQLREQLHVHAAEPGKPLRAEFRLPGQGGGWRWVLAAGAVAERDSQGQVTRMSGVIIDIGDRKQAEAALQRAATTDTLTGLPNRGVLGDRLEQALRSARRHGRHGALLFVDLDHFKRINDVYGHVVGDHVLQATGQRLLAELRDEDTLARMGGDELMVLLPDLGSDADMATSSAEGVGQKLLATLARPLVVDGTEYTLGASMGCTVFPKSPDETGEDLVREADTAMYAAKSAGRGTMRRYEHGMQHNVAERMALERDLRQAIEQQQFSIHLQGKWDGAGRLAGAELLLRWTHPLRGSVSPALFIPVAEDSLLILTIGRWVIEQACALQARWIAEGRALPLAINVSPRQFREPGFAADLVNVTRASGVPPALLTLEVTEGVLLDEGAAQRLEQLAALGFRFSIDDFGTGYSSLMYLKKLPVHELKIDRAFVRDLTSDPEDAAIVQAMLAIARQFKLQVVAEGVETEEQAAFLRLNECHQMQGYLFGRPQAVQAFEASSMPPASA